jgi:hypothetical protein
VGRCIESLSTKVYESEILYTVRGFGEINVSSDYCSTQVTPNVVIIGSIQYRRHRNVYVPVIVVNISCLVPVHAVSDIMGRLGFIQHIQNQWWKVAPVEHVDLTGKTVIVIGAEVGLGFEAAKHFASMNPKRLVLGCRSQEKGQAALQGKRPTL